VQKDSTIYHPSRTCKPDGDGGTLCGIPVGYKGTGRTGTYYLPKTYKQRALPVVIVLHGSGVNGNWMLQSLPFKQYADKHQVIILAPDSKFNMYWILPATAADAFTHDFYHIDGCYKWFAEKNPNKARVNTALVSIAGNSRAGYAAPPFCSRSTVVPCSASVIMHASVLPQQMGRKIIPILWSTGVRDNLYGPSVTNVNRAYFHMKQPKFPIYYRVWDSGHPLNKGQEIDWILKWCITPSFRSKPAPPLGSYRRRLAASPAERHQQQEAPVIEM
jgi:hypothetical protein